jgi:phosphonatase-like hydrolase
MQIQLVIFDMAGTTVRDNDAVHRCLSYALEAGGIDVTRDEVNQVMGMAKPKAIRLLLEKKRPGMQLPPLEEVNAIHDVFLKLMLRFYESDPDVAEIQGAENLFRRLRSAGIQIALDTGFSRPILDTILRRLKWTGTDLLNATVASDEVPQGRPMPDLIYEAMRKTGVANPAQVAKVGDTPSDMLEGQAAGCRYIIGATYGSHTRAEMESQPHTHLIDDIGEVASIVAI